MLKFLLIKKEDQKQNKRNESIDYPKIDSKFYSTFSGLKFSVSNLFRDKKEEKIEEIIDSIKNILITSDFGTGITEKVIKILYYNIKEKKLRKREELLYELELILIHILENKLNVSPHSKQDKSSYSEKRRLRVIILVGANGVGKTTSASKIAYLYQSKGKSVAMVAGDRFRAAAVEQLEILGSRGNIEVLSSFYKKDIDLFIGESIALAEASKKDILIIDTAGRMHTNNDLMQELKKVKKLVSNSFVCSKTTLVLDSNLGQNSFMQAEKFKKEIGVDNLILTKIDGSTGGGIIFSIVDKLKLGVEFLCFGENIKDIKQFNAKEYVNALLQTKGKNLQ